MVLLVQPKFIFGKDSEKYEPWQIALICIWPINTAITFNLIKLINDVPKALMVQGETVALFVSSGIWCIIFETWEHINAEAILWVSCFSITVMLCIMVWIFSANLISVGEASIIRSFDKVWGYIMGYVALGESVGALSATGATFILIAILLLAIFKLKAYKIKEGQREIECATEI